jgi:O-antigen/teichoic acid export membrane protein
MRQVILMVRLFLLKAEGPLGNVKIDLSKYIENNITVLTGHIFIYLAPLLITPIIIKTSGSLFYGNYIMTLTLCSLLVGISSFGIGFKAKRFLPSVGSVNKKKLFYGQFFYHLVFSLLLSMLVVWIFPIIFTGILSNIDVFNPVILIPFLLVSALYSQLADYFRYTQRMILFSYATVARPYFFIIISLISYYYYGKFTINNLLLSQIAGLSLIVLLLFPVVIKEIGIKIYKLKINLIAADIKLGFPLVLVVIFDHILGMSDRYVIAWFMTITDVAYYSVAYTIGMLPIFVAKVAGIILPPMMSKLVDCDDTEGASYLSEISIIVFLVISIPFFFGTLILGKEVLELYSNRETAEHASIAMSIIAFSTIIYGVVLIKINTLFVSMETNKILILNIVGGGINIFLNIVLFSLIRDIYIAAITTLISFSTMLFFITKNKHSQYIFLSRHKKILVSVILSSFIMLVLVWYVKNTMQFNNITIKVVLCLIFLSLFVYGFGLFLMIRRKYFKSYGLWWRR